MAKKNTLSKQAIIDSNEVDTHAVVKSEVATKRAIEVFKKEKKEAILELMEGEE